MSNYQHCNHCKAGCLHVTNVAANSSSGFMYQGYCPPCLKAIQEAAPPEAKKPRPYPHVRELLLTYATEMESCSRPKGYNAAVRLLRGADWEFFRLCRDRYDAITQMRELTPEQA